MKIHEILGEMTSAGGIATVAAPLGGGDQNRAYMHLKNLRKKRKLRWDIVPK